MGIRKRSPQLVWSGPEASGLAGDTGDIYEELFSSAKQSLWVASFVSDHDPDVFGELAANIDTTPGLEVRLLLNINRRRRERDRRHRCLFRRSRPPVPSEAVQLFRAKLSTGSGPSRPGLSGDREGVLDMDGSGVAGGGGGLLG